MNDQAKNIERAARELLGELDQELRGTFRAGIVSAIQELRVALRRTGGPVETGPGCQRSPADHIAELDRLRGGLLTGSASYTVRRSESLQWAVQQLTDLHSPDGAAAQTVEGPRWRFESVALSGDRYGIGCDLVNHHGEVLASCLWANGELDTESDGCGVFVAGIRPDEIEWPSELEAEAAIG